jgi:hypothetical protein
MRSLYALREKRSMKIRSSYFFKGNVQEDIRVERRKALDNLYYLNSFSEIHAVEKHTIPPKCSIFEGWTKYQVVRMKDVGQKCTLQRNVHKDTGQYFVSSDKTVHSCKMNLLLKASLQTT